MLLGFGAVVRWSKITLICPSTQPTGRFMFILSISGSPKSCWFLSGKIQTMNGRNNWIYFTGIVIIGLLLTGAVIVIVQIPAIHERLTWRLEVASTYLRSAVQPAGALPTALATEPPVQTDTPLPSTTPAQIATATPTAILSPTPTFSPTPIPGRVVLEPPEYEKQKPNDCGPATLTHVPAVLWLEGRPNHHL